nr:MAG TPA: hypothetical protein [Caudoviricetes sp.]DAS82720.1 MAG TPA: hypothetical protein [Caudoviricetes sp.]
MASDRSRAAMPPARRTSGEVARGRQDRRGRRRGRR